MGTDTGKRIYYKHIYNERRFNKNGIYLGAKITPAKVNQNKYAFLPATGISVAPQRTYSNVWMATGIVAYYWSATTATDNTDYEAYCLNNSGTSPLHLQ